MIAKKIKEALTPLGCPIARIFYTGKSSSFFVIQQITTLPADYADDDYTTYNCFWRIDLYSKTDYSELLKNAIEALKNADFIIESIDAELYEDDTQFYHIPININYKKEY